ncbi:hypothetical protein KL949_002511 [Ogataea haglerorum]|nr:hypothetical protein KL913_004188 [Ogataea haglerorum]KAG7719519.1 hypothetical protein KL949_002511 [Ogataea haglerorum]KAG7767572.1 hypothetical protein KL931_003385 [Ogataea haglerorum]KAG7801429.1 hypothetical protein KL944_003161 [Ogataea haglerorum]
MDLLGDIVEHDTATEPQAPGPAMSGPATGADPPRKHRAAEQNVGGGARAGKGGTDQHAGPENPADAAEKSRTRQRQRHGREPEPETRAAQGQRLVGGQEGAVQQRGVGQVRQAVVAAGDAEVEQGGRGVGGHRVPGRRGAELRGGAAAEAGVGAFSKADRREAREARHQRPGLQRQAAREVLPGPAQGPQGTGVDEAGAGDAEAGDVQRGCGAAI